MSLKKVKKPFSFCLGADPEFSLTMQGRKVDARVTLENLLKGKKNFKSVPNQGYEVGDHGNIGWDGMSATGEIRPSASPYPQGVVGHIMAIFKEFSKHMNMFDMLTVSEFGSLGGHIHFEMPKGQKWSNEKQSNIHRKIASFYLPILMSENKTNLNLRMKGGYGKIEDARFEPHFKYPDGTQGYTYEFRTPSAEWLTHPKIAQATLAYLGVVYNEILNHPKSFSKFNDVVYKSDKAGQALQTLSIMDFELLTRVMANKIRKYVRTFEMYDQYKAEIEYILTPGRVMKDKLRADFNIGIGWGLVQKATTPRKRDVMGSKARIAKLVKGKDMDLIKNVVNINYNDDTNIGLFIDALRERIAAFNWKLKMNYFVFGMRKGIKDIIVRDGSHRFIGENNQIKTLLDEQEVNRLFDRMEKRFYNNFDNVPDCITIDFKTGKPKTTKEFNVILGLPYDLRTSKDVKPFLEMIWNIEKGTIKPKERVNLKENSLIDDYNDETKRGEIFKLLTKEEPQKVVVDEQSMQNAQGNIANFVDESNRAERSEREEARMQEEEAAQVTPAPIRVNYRVTGIDIGVDGTDATNTSPRLSATTNGDNSL